MGLWQCMPSCFLFNTSVRNKQNYPFVGLYKSLFLLSSSNPSSAGAPGSNGPVSSNREDICRYKSLECSTKDFPVTFSHPNFMDSEENNISLVFTALRCPPLLVLAIKARIQGDNPTLWLWFPLITHRRSVETRG